MEFCGTILKNINARNFFLSFLSFIRTFCTLIFTFFPSSSIITHWIHFFSHHLFFLYFFFQSSSLTSFYAFTIIFLSLHFPIPLSCPSVFLLSVIISHSLILYYASIHLSTHAHTCWEARCDLKLDRSAQCFLCRFWWRYQRNMFWYCKQ